MNMKRWLFLTSLLLVTAAAGCATIASGTTQAVTVSSNVDGAEIYLDGIQVGRTPFTGSVKKGGEQLRIEADGYRAETLALSKSLDPIFWGNIIIGGTIGSITDFFTGAAYQYAPAAYQVDLQPADQSDEDFEHEVALRKFSMVYIDEIAADLSRDGGPYVDMLLEIVAMRGTTTATTADVREAFSTTHGNPITFGNEIAGLRF